MSDGADDVEVATPFDMNPEEFRALGHRMVDQIAEFLDSVATRRRTTATAWTPADVRRRLPSGDLPEAGADDVRAMLDEAAGLIFDGFRRNGHPGYWGYVIGSPAPLGILADFLASAANANLAAWNSAPVPTEIELQAVHWIAQLLGYPGACPGECGGLLTSGGNMANFIGVLAARRARAPWNVREEGLSGPRPRLRLYASRETHTWIQKAADLFGLGTDAIRWIGTDPRQRIGLSALRAQIEADRAHGDLPFLLVGSAGTVSTGAVDPLPEMARIAEQQGLWFHVDGAYGAPAVCSDMAPEDLEGLRQADSVAVDAHKWLYVPLEAGCVLVRDRRALRETFAYHPPYYHYADVGEEIVHFQEHGPQNSRYFRALKVWLVLRRAGRANYAAAIGRNIALSREMHRCVADTPELEAVTQSLSIATFRFVPADLDTRAAGAEAYLNELNTALVERIQEGGRIFVSSAVVDGRFLLRACITNFRTAEEDVRALPEIVVRLGRALDGELRPAFA